MIIPTTQIKLLLALRQKRKVSSKNSLYFIAMNPGSGCQVTTPPQQQQLQPSSGDNADFIASASKQ
jgi:hypothetical protein